MAETTTETKVTTKATGAPGQPVATREEAHAIAAKIMGAGRPPAAVMEREPPKLTERYWAKRTFGYGGSDKDRGQVFKLSGAPNDRRLVDLGYVALLEPGTTTYACGICGAEFLDMGLRDGHGKARHTKSRFVPPPPPVREPTESLDSYQNRLDEWALAAGRMSDARDEQRDRLENEVAPLDLTKTAASRG
jgi:hypothetical protein